MKLKLRTNIICRYCNKRLKDLISHKCSAKEKKEAKWNAPNCNHGKEPRMFMRINKDMNRLPADTRNHYKVIKELKS